MAIRAWSSTAIYTKGMEVTENGVTYVANWWTEDNNPATNNGVIGTGEPWTIVAALPPASAPTTPSGVAASGTTSSATTLAPPPSGQYFSPYIDMGLTADSDLPSLVAGAGLKDVTLAFVQSSG